MEMFYVEGSEDTPRINLNKEKNIFEVTGRSIPEDPAAFYKPLLEWIGRYAGEANPSTAFVFKLEYFNTMSAKIILDILFALESIPNITVQWYFQEDDEDMEEAGEEFCELVKIPFEFKSY